LARATLGTGNDWQEQLLAAHATIGSQAISGTSNFRANLVQLLRLIENFDVERAAVVVGAR
jgi:hypothetical protein